MNIVIAVDSFKGSISSIGAGNAIAEGIKRVDGQAEISVLPVADGGEGTVDALVQGMQGSYRQVIVTGPLGKKLIGHYGLLECGRTAVMEISSAAGLTLISKADRNPMITTTYGVGDMIKDAVLLGCRRFIIGIGGSAANDGGIGMLQALGFGLLDADYEQVPFGAEGLKKLKYIKQDGVLKELKECEFSIACDVENVLCGENGCSAVFAPQKGADPNSIWEMDRWMKQYAQLAKEVYQEADELHPGSGAAGGLGFAFKTFLNGSLNSGIGTIIEMTRLESYIKEADIVVTGEGRLDAQTAMGKAPAGVAWAAKKYGKKVIAFAGSAARDAGVLNQKGIDAFFPILRECTSLEDAMNPVIAAENLKDTAEQVFRLFFKY